MLVVYDLSEFLWSLGLHIHLRNWKLWPLSLEKGTCTHTCSILYKICGHSQGSVGYPIDLLFLIITHMEIFRRHLKTWLEQFRIRDSYSGLNLHGGVSSSHRCHWSLERPSALGSAFLKEGEEARKKETENGRVSGQKKAFKRLSKAIVIWLCTVGFRNLWSWYFLNFNFRFVNYINSDLYFKVVMIF